MSHTWLSRSSDVAPSNTVLHHVRAFLSLYFFFIGTVSKKFLPSSKKGTVDLCRVQLVPCSLRPVSRLYPNSCRVPDKNLGAGGPPQIRRSTVVQSLACICVRRISLSSFRLSVREQSQVSSTFEFNPACGSKYNPIQLKFSCRSSDFTFS